MSRDRDLTDRLSALRSEGGRSLAPLWIETLSAEEALEELAPRQGAVYRLQEARVLGTLGRTDEAHSVISELEELPPGLRSVRDGLALQLAQGKGDRSAASGTGAETEGLASITLAELYATQGEEGAALAVYERLLAAAPNNASLQRRVEDLRAGRRTKASAPASPESRKLLGGAEVRVLEAWLAQVRGWRRTLGV